MIENLQWTGWGESTPDLLDFLRQGGPIGVSYWLEEPMVGAHGADLSITYRGSRSEPLRIFPGEWVHFDGARFGPGRRKGGRGQ